MVAALLSLFFFRDFSALAFVCVLLVRLPMWSCLSTVVLLHFPLLFIILWYFYWALSYAASFRLRLCSAFLFLLPKSSVLVRYFFMSILYYFVCFWRCWSSFHCFPQVLCAASAILLAHSECICLKCQINITPILSQLPPIMRRILLKT